MRGLPFLAAALLVCTAVRATDPPLFLIDTPFDPLPSGIYLVEPGTGVMTQRASLDVSYGPMLALAAVNDTVFYASGGDALGCFSCFLYRITLDPGSTTPLEILPIGPFLDGTTPVIGVTGMTFRSDGALWMIDEVADGLYVVDPATAQATRIATMSIDLLGGDITFDTAGTMWLWSNGPSNHGLYQVDPATAVATPLVMRPDVRLAGLAALRFGNVMYGASPFIDSLYEILIPSGFTGFQPPLVFNGSQFDHKRGDLASPFCTNHAYCDDANPCTTDTCTQGGCAYAPVPGCCTSNANCDDGDPCTTGEACVSGTCQPGVPVVLPEVTGLAAGPGKTTYSWAQAAGASTYDVVRGPVAGLPVGPGTDETCFSGIAGLQVSDAVAPSPGQAFWYLVRASGACGLGTFGVRSNGATRATSACP